MRYCIILLPFALLLLFAAVNGEPAKRAPSANNSNSTVSTKAPEKVAYPKKVTSLKKRPTKSSTVLSATTPTTTTVKPKKSAQLVAASFKNLTADDLEFIEELDKQFNLHGDKIKIKVERENSTDSKTSKRTIESELGYGHAPNGYEYPKPKFMFYPYSQQDIPSNAPGYHSSFDHSSITIEPSYSYELNPQSFAAPATPQIDLPAPEAHSYHATAHDAEQPQQHYEEPVIVLRIPGPAKYASHLQTLLQQYLEIRAKQYLHILENSEQQHHHQAELQQHHQEEQQQHQQHFEQHYSTPEQHYAAPQYEHSQYEQAAPQHEDYHQQELSYAHHAAPTPQPISYPAIDDVYQHYKGRHQHEHQQQHQQQQHHQQQHQQQPVEYAPQYYQQESYAHATADAQDHAEVPQYYYMHAQQYEQPGQPIQHEQHYQQIYLVAMPPAAQSQPIYEEPQEEPQPSQHEQQHQQPIYVQEVAQQEHEQDPLPTSENNPRHTHTKVIFTHNSEQGAQDYSSQYALPSIKPHERHAPRITPNYQHYQQQQQQHAAESASAAAAIGVEEQPEQQHASAAHREVSATPRPFNYHAHAQRGRRTRGNAKRGTTVVDPDQQFKQISEVVASKLGAKKGHSMEFKTTEVIAG